MQAFSHRLDRELHIDAPPTVVFRFFMDSQRWAAWWGPGSRIDARIGGDVLIRYPGGTEASGTVVEIEPPERIVFTYGYVGGEPIPPGGSLVTIQLENDGGATILRLTHEFAESGVAEQHEQGWRYQLSLFSNVVLDEVHQDAAAAVDAWFGLWSEPDDDRRSRLLSAISTNHVRVRDRYSAISGRSELLAHIVAARRFMAGITTIRTGDIRHCQGMVLASWVAHGADNLERASGASVFAFGPTGLIESVTGFVNPMP